jgi:DUF2924 family protein
MARRSTKPTMPSWETTELVKAGASLDKLRRGRRRLPEAAGGRRSLDNSNPTINKEGQLRAEVEMLRSLGKDELRVRWTKMFGKAPPPALTKDLLGRMIAWRIQEQFYGGHSRAILKLLERLARGEAAKPSTEPQLRPGTVLMREHRGLRHTVTVIPDGFVWQDKSFSSLSAVARAITGTSWNGRRFFGLRTERKTDQAGNDQ